MTQLLLVKAAGARYALPALRVGAVLRLEGVTRVPLTAPEILGLVHVRGKTLGLVHLARLFDAQALPPREGGVAVTIETDFDAYAVVVDDVDEVVFSVDVERIEPLGHVERRRAALTDHFVRVGLEVIPVLDVNRLFEPVSDAGSPPHAVPNPLERRP